MKLKLLAFLTCTASLFFNTSKAQTIKENNNFSDTTRYLIDTSINDVNIDNKHFSIDFLRDKFDKDSVGKIDMLSLVIRDIKTHDVIYYKKFTENQYNIFKVTDDSLNVKGKLYLEVEFIGGGSGLSGDCYEITAYKNNIKIHPIYTFNELSLIYFNGDNEIIVLDGIWDFDNKNEYHFSNHRYLVTKYDYINGKFIPTKLGKTRFKYSSYNDGKYSKQILIGIKKKEPVLLKSINLNASASKEKRILTV